MVRVDLAKPIEVKVQVEAHGLALGVKDEGGFLDIVMREIDVVGVRADPNTAEEVIPLITKGTVRIRPMISHRFPLADFGRALETFSKNLDNAIKVVIEP